MESRTTADASRDRRLDGSPSYPTRGGNGLKKMTRHDIYKKFPNLRGLSIAELTRIISGVYGNCDYTYGLAILSLIKLKKSEAN